MSSIENERALKVKTLLIDPKTQKSKLSILLSPKQSSTFIPVDKNAYTSQIATKAISFPLETLDRQKARVEQDLKSRFSNITIIAEVMDAIGTIFTGDVVIASITSKVSELENNTYSGNFLVKRAEHRFFEGRLVSILTLIKPNSKKSTWVKGSVLDV
jgi:hypothetical protein